ncbi:MAG: hypothetical protein KF688_06980 [Pirellulales bacterium]|nr:hypothetical protein [Pirellulales bacterium]
MSSVIRILWASPWSLAGASLGLLGLATGGRAQVRSGVIEFHGGAVTWLLRRMPCIEPVAMALGHTVLGQSPAALDVCRKHELVHVRQYERWGPLFVPAYFACSAWIWLRGGDPYHDNPFEREAYSLAP